MIACRAWSFIRRFAIADPPFNGDPRTSRPGSCLVVGNRQDSNRHPSWPLLVFLLLHPKNQCSDWNPTMMRRRMMMNALLLAALCFLIIVAPAAATASMPEIPADSALGQRLVQSARRLNNNDNNNNNNQQSQELFSWVSSYSVKFQGCMSIKQWNVNADEAEDVKIADKHLVRFRLCPSDTCSSSKAAGCTSGYGDYIIDLEIYMKAIMEAMKQQTEAACYSYRLASCDCENGGENGGGENNNNNNNNNNNGDYCQYDCFNAAGMVECIDRNPYEDNGQQEQFRVEDYMECTAIKANNGQKRRFLEGEDQQQQDDTQYYVGPYCGNQGGEVLLGLFSDDTCSEMVSADVAATTFASIMGYDLPYTTTSLVNAKCVTCVEIEQGDDQRNNNNQNQEAEADPDDDVDAVSESCESLYLYSGKCEANLPSSMLNGVARNENACNYMEGIKIVRMDGIIDRSAVRPSAIATAFIVIFAMAFAAMAFYVWYLRTRLGVKQNTLL
jgi:hypothetical protein